MIQLSLFPSVTMNGRRSTRMREATTGRKMSATSKLNTSDVHRGMPNPIRVARSEGLLLMNMSGTKTTTVVMVASVMARPTLAHSVDGGRSSRASLGVHTRDVLHDNHGVVDQHPDAQGQPGHGGHVEAAAGEVLVGDGQHHREGDGQCDAERHAHAAQEKEEHEDRQAPAPQRRWTEAVPRTSPMNLAWSKKISMPTWPASLGSSSRSSSSARKPWAVSTTLAELSFWIIP